MMMGMRRKDKDKTTDINIGRTTTASIIMKEKEKEKEKKKKKKKKRFGAGMADLELDPRLIRIRDANVLRWAHTLRSDSYNRALDSGISRSSQHFEFKFGNGSTKLLTIGQRKPRRRHRAQAWTRRPPIVSLFALKTFHSVSQLSSKGRCLSNLSILMYQFS